MAVNTAVAAATLHGYGFSDGSDESFSAEPVVILVKPPTLPLDVLCPPVLDPVPRASLASAVQEESRPEPVPPCQPPEIRAPDWLAAAPSPAILAVPASAVPVPRIPAPRVVFGAGDAAVTPPEPDTAIETRYWEDVRRRVAAELRYPVEARRRGVSGDVTLCVAVNAGGLLIEAKPVAADVADSALSDAAVSATRRAAPFPPPSFASGAGTNMVVALLPIRFELVTRERTKAKEHVE